MKRALAAVAALWMIAGVTGCGGAQEAKTMSGDEPSNPVRNEGTAAFVSPKVDGTGFVPTHVEAMAHTMKADGQTYPAVIVHLANYDRGGRSYLPNPKTPGHRRVLLNFSGPTGGALRVGTYGADVAPGAGHRFSLGIEGTAGSAGFEGAVTGVAELTRLTAEAVAGRVEMKDARGASINATFTARITRSRY